ncbi:bifunctional diguanylate cyclase/phosphodiesterase [Undibacterium sp. TJN25]|uniref:bifunctional diguanylate cyclase/phosphodiesterase n=1 Tax=Undibacterium sp. TJN25 TaxID=3413056 RepID=UPI003BF1F0AA
MIAFNKKAFAVRAPALEWLALGSVLLVGVLISTYFIWDERALSTTADVERMRMQALVISESINRQLDGARNALVSTRAAMLPASDCRANCRELLLQSLKSAMPGVRALMVVDRNGNIVISNDDIGDSQLDDRDYKRKIETMRSPDTLYLSDPYENTRGVFNIKLSMAILNADGSSNGAVCAILNPEYFNAVMRSALYARDMNSAITESSGRHILFVPADPAEMRHPGPVSDMLFTRHQRSHLAETVLRGAAGGEQRLVVQRTMPENGLGLDRSLVVSLSRSQAAVNRGWLGLLLAVGIAWLVFGFTTGGVLAFVQRRRRLMEALAQANADEQSAAAQKVELALSGANLGLWDWNITTDMRIVDERAAAMLGYTPQELNTGSIHWRQLTHADDLPGLDATIAAHLENNAVPFEAEHRMRHRAGHWVWLQSRGKIVERGEDGKALRMLGTRMDISARKQAEAEIAHLAFYDGLTNLPNRRLLLDRLHHAISRMERSNSYSAVLFVDLDNFKSLNDTMGHDVGDRLLQMVAFRLQDVTRDTDTVARLGGDEFVILLEDLGNDRAHATSNSANIANKIVETLSDAYLLEGHDLRSTPSIGVVVFGAEHHTVNDLLRQADMAMYEAKAAGRATFRFFDPRMQVELDSSASLESDLRMAIQRQELQLHYQPVVDTNACVAGVEALLRWKHPSRGMIGPGEFIPQAEKSGLIVELGAWVLETACLQLVHWAASEKTRHLTMAVNVSARQFRQPAFVEKVLSILERTGADPYLLKLELTESMLLTDMDDVIVKMTTLKQHGVSFALDDFGTGYSSLSYLQLLPIAQLKIDRSFVQDMLHTRHASSIVRAIVTLAHSMDLNVVAEGVENHEQWSALADIGCKAFQGYFFGRPVPVQDLRLKAPAESPAMVAANCCEPPLSLVEHDQTCINNL